MSLSDLLSPSRREARRLIEAHLREGVLTLDEIAAEIDLELDDALGADATRSLVGETWQRVSKEPPARPTPLDRLQAAFDALDAAGVMARHYPAAGRSEAESWIRDELALAAHAGRTYFGYSYYDRALRQMMSEGGLGLCFGSATSRTTFAQLWREQARAGQAIVDALEANGFQAEWSGQVADVILIGGVAWRGPRDGDGAPLVPLGTRLEGRAPPPAPEPAGPGIAEVFVSCANGRADAHRLVAAIAGKTGEPMYGGPERFDAVPAAVAVPTGAGPVLDFVAGESTPGVRGLLACRDLADACGFTVAVAPTVGEVDTEWWTRFPPEKRVLVVTQGGARSVHEGSPVQPVDLASGTGVAELLELMATAVG